MADARVSLPIEGMTCGACAVTVQKRLAKVPGVRAAAVNFATAKATLTVDESVATVASLVAAVRDAGYDCTKASATLEIEGLHYAAGVARLEAALGGLSGVLTVVANQASEQVRVEYVPGLVSARELEAAVLRSGFHLAERIAEEDPVERERERRRREVRVLTWKLAVAAMGAVVTMVGSMPLMGAMEAKGSDLVARVVAPAGALLERLLPWLYAVAQRDPGLLKLVMLAVTVPVVAWSGRQFFVGAWRGLQHRSADMNTLIAVGTGAAFLYSAVATLIPTVFTRAGLPADVYYEATTAIIALILLGRLLEARARGQTSEAVRRLLGLRPKTATVRRGRAGPTWRCRSKRSRCSTRSWCAPVRRSPSTGSWCRASRASTRRC